MQNAVSQNTILMLQFNMTSVPFCDLNAKPQKIMLQIFLTTYLTYEAVLCD